MPGETMCGDTYFIHDEGDMHTYVVIDGLGHGAPASIPAKRARETIESSLDEPLQAIMEKVHQTLRSTRGAAVSMIRLDRLAGNATFLGIGNVNWKVLPAEGRHPLTNPGIVGYRFRTKRDHTFPVGPGTTIAMFSDGISSRLVFPDGHEDMDLEELLQTIVNESAKDSDDATLMLIRAPRM